MHVICVRIFGVDDRVYFPVYGTGGIYRTDGKTAYAVTNSIISHTGGSWAAVPSSSLQNT